MATKLDKIRGALGLMRTQNLDAHWNEDGTAKLEVVQKLAGEADITLADLVEANGGMPTRGDEADPKDAADEGTEDGGIKAAPPAPELPKAAITKPGEDREDGTGDGKPGTEPAEAVVLDHKLVVAQADAAIDELDPVIIAAAQEAEAAAAKLAELTREKSKLLELREQHDTPISNAEAVRRIQAQTQEALAARKAKMQAVGAAAAEVGLKGHASNLDAALAQGGRRSQVLRDGQVYVATPQTNAQNAGKFYAQRAAERLANRLGTPA